MSISHKVLVVGNGGREHALAWSLLQSDQVTKVVCAPGNGGTARLSGCENRAISVDDFQSLEMIVQEEEIDFVIIGPELPLALGITDILQKKGIKVFGPTQIAAQIESSKAWAKELFKSAAIPTAASETFSEIEGAKAYLKEKGAPIVIKADGLAAGKGVIIAMSPTEADQAVETLFSEGYQKLVIEEYLEGQEVSVLAVTDGLDFRLLLPAQDHKRIGEGNTGLNTGGMGAYCPAPILTPALEEQVKETILAPTIRELRKRGIDYCGVLYAGLMISPEGVAKILEFNCRFGDPETQVILPLLKTPLDEIILACINQRLGEFPPLEWHQGHAVCVIAASGGYPCSYNKGNLITGVKTEQVSDALIFHSGTTYQGDNLLTNGGRVLGVTGIGSDLNTARSKAYATLESISFEGIYYRRDIGNY